MRHLTRREQAVVELAWLLRDCQRERRLTQPLHIAGNKAVRGKIDDTVICERRVLERSFARILLQMDVAPGGSELGGDHVPPLTGGLTIANGRRH